MKKKASYKVYAPQIVDGETLRNRINALSKCTGKKIYQIAKEAIEIGLEQLEANK